MPIPWELATISRSEEWNAGVILATLAFTVVFVILSILAASIKITSKTLSLRGRKTAVKVVKKKPPYEEKPKAKPLSYQALAEVAAAAATMHKSLEIVAAVAAVHHHVVTHRVSALYALPKTITFSKPWVIVWLNEATYKPEINPYIKEVVWNARNL